MKPQSSKFKPRNTHLPDFHNDFQLFDDKNQTFSLTKLAYLSIVAYYIKFVKRKILISSFFLMTGSLNLLKTTKIATFLVTNSVLMIKPLAKSLMTNTPRTMH